MNLPAENDSRERVLFLWKLLRENFRLAALREIERQKSETIAKTHELRERLKKTASQQRDSRMCKVCWDDSANTICLDCGHQSLCAACGTLLSFCPVCMATIRELVRLR
ncbi:unnamed protein product [Phaeothamnion confervicola]